MDSDAGAAYLRISSEPVARTVEFNEDIYVDVGQFEMVIGVELIDLSVSLPLDQLARQFHISSETLTLLEKAIEWVRPPETASTATDYVAGDSATPVLSG